MKPRDRVLDAVEHREPDRVPLDLFITPTAYLNVKRYLGVQDEDTVKWGWVEPLKVCEKILERLHIDVRRVYFSRPKNWVPRRLPGGVVEDEWGRRFKVIGEYYEIVHYPLAGAVEVEDVEDYPYPDPYAPGRTEGLRRKARELFEKTGYAIMGFPMLPSMDMFDPGLCLMGMKSFLLNLKLNPRLVEAYMDKMCELLMGFYDNFLGEVGEYIQIIYGMSLDSGHQRGMLLSPQDWRKTFKPRLKRLYSYVKGKAPEAKIFFHSCGAIRPIIKDLIEVGVDILNPIQPLAEGMNPESLKEEFGEKICFHGGIDVQQVMSSIGALKDVEYEVKGKIKALGPGGGYILASSHNLQPDSSPEKIVAMYDYALKYGKYPIKIN